MAAALLSGCDTVETLSFMNKAPQEYGEAETMVFVTTERLRYEALYTDAIWTVAVDAQGTTFEDALEEQIHAFLIDLRTMSEIAREQELELTDAEQELARSAAAQYVDALGAAHMETFGLQAEMVQSLYADYLLAEKYVESVTGEVNLEVSDSEAKVIEISQIEVSDPETAEELHAKVCAEGADFYGIAKESSESETIRRQIANGDADGACERAAFAMEDGEVSGVVADDGKYYILKCDEDYNEEATRIHKEQMMREKKQAVFHQAYAKLKTEKVFEEDKALWESMTISGSPKVEADFFAVLDALEHAES